MTERARLEDNGEPLDRFMDGTFIRCPKCSECAIWERVSAKESIYLP